MSRSRRHRPAARTPRSWWPDLPPLRLPRRPVLPAVRVPRRLRGAAPGRWVRDLRSPGVLGRSYEVYLPAGLWRRSRVPMVMLLHGCRQTPEEFAEATRFTTVADRNRFVLVVPRQEPRHHSQRCWRWYESAHQHRGSGEPAALAAVARQVAAEDDRRRIDPLRVHVAGLSAGGGMALVLAARYADMFAAVGVHSAPAYRSAIHAGQALPAMGGRTLVPLPGMTDPAMAPLIVVQGAGDDIVRPTNGDRVADQWLTFRSSASSGEKDPARIARSRTDHGKAGDGREYTRVRWYTAKRHRVLEYWLVEGLGHAWSGGRAGGSYSDPAGPRAATLMWDFFRTHRLQRGAGTVSTAASG